LVFAAQFGAHRHRAAVDVPVVTVVLTNRPPLGAVAATCVPQPSDGSWRHRRRALARRLAAISGHDRGGERLLVGTALGACLAVAVVGAIASYLTKAWQQIAVRVLASWIAASAILVLAMSWR
jgi:hypothetical protein